MVKPVPLVEIFCIEISFTLVVSPIAIVWMGVEEFLAIRTGFLPEVIIPSLISIIEEKSSSEVVIVSTALKMLVSG